MMIASNTSRYIGLIVFNVHDCFQHDGPLAIELIARSEVGFRQHAGRARTCEGAAVHGHDRRMARRAAGATVTAAGP